MAFSSKNKLVGHLFCHQKHSIFLSQKHHLIWIQMNIQIQLNFLATFSLMKSWNIFSMKVTNMLYKLILINCCCYNKPLLLTKQLLEQFIGILFMPIIKMPSAKSYWELETCYDKIVDIMSYSRFLKSNDLFIATTIQPHHNH